MANDLWRIGAVVVLVLLNGFFVAAEYSFVSARRTRIDQLAAEGSSRARLVQRAMGDTNRFISATQTGVTLMSLLLGAIGEPALEEVIEPLFAIFLPAQTAFFTATGVAFIVALVIVTYVEIIIGEQVPKMLALQKAETTILIVAPVVRQISIIFRPIIDSLYWSTKVCLKALGLKYQGERNVVYSEEELKMLVNASTAGGVLEVSEERMINRVFEFANLTAAQIMVPRTEISAVPVDISLQDLTQIALREHHTRFPVYDRSLDNIIGAVHTKDLVGILGSQQSAQFSVLQILRQVLTIPETKPIDDLMADMQRRRNHMAIVIDEYGGTSGLVTMEDVLERIVGDVQDEFQTEEPDVQPLSDGSYIINGLLSVEEFTDRFGYSFDDTEYNTVGGVVFGELGREPVVGDEVDLDFGHFWVVAMDGLRISKLRVKLKTARPRDRIETPAGETSA